MMIESMTSTPPEKVTGWKGIPDAVHFDRLKVALFNAKGRGRFDRAAADGILDDLRNVAYRHGIAAASIFQFVDDDFIEADESLAATKDDLDHMSRNLPFLKTVTAVVEEIESIRDEMTEDARTFFGWRRYSGKWASPNPIWSELRQAFQEGRDDVGQASGQVQCPIFIP